jgi:hypothetical protein
MVPTTAGDAAGTGGDGEVKEEGVAVGALSSSSAPQATRRLAARMRRASKKNVREGCRPAVRVESRFMRSSSPFAFFDT